MTQGRHTKRPQKKTGSHKANRAGMSFSAEGRHAGKATAGAHAQKRAGSHRAASKTSILFNPVANAVKSVSNAVSNTQMPHARAMRLSAIIPSAAVLLALAGGSAATATSGTILAATDSEGSSVSRNSSRGDLLSERQKTSSDESANADFIGRTQAVNTNELVSLTADQESARRQLSIFVNAGRDFYNATLNKVSATLSGKLGEAVDTGQAMLNTTVVSLEDLRAQIIEINSCQTNITRQLSSKNADSYNSSGSGTVPVAGQGYSVSGTNGYPYGQCTWWACLRRSQLGLPCSNYFGNAGWWAVAAAASGYATDNVPTVGSIIVFSPGQYGASSVYGHVGIVESVHEDGSITISESNVLGQAVISERTFTAGQAAAVKYIH